ncbi:MAG: helix-turn-helix domain-containing protein [Eubacteriales bacterium]|nr:helix-turn-helix domain-containing protein [Eubacteriales bacterium]
MPKNDAVLSFPVIVAAVNGNVDAINAVLKRYEGYIAQLSTRKLYDEDGNSYVVVDEEMRRRLETKLITKILKFKVA